MAKKVENKDIFADDLFKKTVTDVELLLAELNKLEQKFIEIAKVQKNLLGKSDTKTIEGIRATNDSITKLSETEKAFLKLQSDKLKLEAKLEAARTNQGQQNAELNYLLKEQNKINSQNVEMAKKDIEAKNRQKQAVIQQKQAAKELSAQQKQAAKELEIQQKKAAKELEIQSNAFKRLTRDTNLAQAEFKKLAAQFGVNSTQARNAKVRFDELDGRLRKVNEAARDGHRDVGRYGTAFSKLGGVLRSGLGALGIVAGISGIVRGIGAAINIFKDFEAANSKLKSVLGATKEEMGQLSQQAKDLGSTTAFTASQVTELQTEFAKLGFPTKEILNMTASTLDAAAAMGSQLGEQAALTGATIKAFGLSSKDAARVNDVLAKSTARSALDFSKLNASMSTIAPVANAMGFGLEDTVSLLGNLSDSGFDASTAATATRNIMLKLADSSSVLGKRLKEPVKDLPSLIKGLKQLTDEGVDLSQALELTDVRSVAAFATFMKGTDSLEKLSAELNNANGAAKEMADTMLDNLSGDITKATSAWEGFILSLEDGTGALSGLFRGAVQGVTSFLGMLTKTDTAIEKSIKSLEEERNELTKLQVELNTTNVNSQRRIEMIQQLKDEYPELLSNINTETASLEDLQAALTKVNDSVRTRLLLQKAAEKGDNLQALATARKQQAEEILNDILIEGTELLIEKGKAELLQGKSTKEQVEIIKSYAGTFSTLNFNIDRYNGILEDSSKWQKTTNEEKEKATKIINELLKTNGDLNELTTQELKNLIKTGVLTDKKLNQQAREIIIMREANATIKENTEVTAKGNKVSREKSRILGTLITQTRALTKAEKETADEERERRKAQAKADIEELKKRFGIRKTQLKDLDAANKRTEEREAEILKRRKELTEAALEVISSMLDEYHKKELEAIDRQISATEKRVDQLRKKAELGQLASEESLAFEQKKQAELEQQRLKMQKQQQREQALFTVISTYQQKVNSGDPNPLLSTIKDIAVLKSFASTLAGFYDGTDDVGKSLGKPQLSGKDGHIIRVDGKEQIWSNKDRAEVGFRSRDEIKDLVGLVDNNMLNNITNRDVFNPSGFVLNGLMDKKVLDKLNGIEQAISKIDIPEGMVKIDEVRGLINLYSRKANKQVIERSKLFK